MRDPLRRVSVRRIPAIAIGAVHLVWRAARRELIGTLVLQLLASAVLALQVICGRFLLLRLVRASDTGRGDFHRAVPWMVAVAALLAIGAVISVLQTELGRVLGEMMARYSTGLVIDVALAAELVDFDRPSFHDRLQRATVNASMRPVQMTSGLVSVLSSSIGALAVSVTLLFIEPWLLVVGVLSIGPVTAVSIKLGRALYRFSVEQTPLDRQRSYIQHLLMEKDSAKEVRAYQLAPFLKARFDHLYDRRLAALRKLVRRRSVQGVLGGLLTGLATGGTLALLIFFLSDGRISLAGAGAALGALLLLGSQVRTLASGLGGLYESALYIEDFNDFVQVQVPTGRGRQAPREEVPTGPIVVDDVSFTYPSRSEPSLTDVSLTIPRGHVIALVGVNGSGKTTLAKMLAGLYHPQAGTITWGHGDPTQPERVAVLFQDFVKYFMTARDNIVVGDWERADEDEQIVAAARRAGADEMVRGLAGGYDALLGPQFLGGSDMSGGQWQRIGLARAFFRDASLVVLDEPTASLDPQAEADLFASVRDLFDNRSVVLITHRFGNVRTADRIYVLDGGRIIEQGGHDELMDLGGTYFRLYSMQAQAFATVEQSQGPGA